jgi:hypothetical protein
MLARDEELRVRELQRIRRATRSDELVPAPMQTVYFRCDRPGGLVRIVRLSPTPKARNRFEPLGCPAADRAGIGANVARGPLQVACKLPVLVEIWAGRERESVGHTNLLSTRPESALIRLKEGSCPSIRLWGCVDTAEPKLDEHQRSDDFFEIAQFPTLSFCSTKIVATGGNDSTSRETSRFAMSRSASSCRSSCWAMPRL